MPSLWKRSVSLLGDGVVCVVFRNTRLLVFRADLGWTCWTGRTRPYVTARVLRSEPHVRLLRSRVYTVPHNATLLGV